ncbi:hypothetical protein EV178_003056 [Coemansia sp. RSA 1646]|nr:hypothetical protein EV178_003056 [Coemansia sp. RSA 1646]KAJ2089401.1 hypothetical protein IW138_003431 [Coemansia sp. RSA 986]
MAQTLANSMQSPATPVRQLGAARGQRRTPASRSKKPYTRPSAAKSEGLKTGYDSDSNSGFLKGMRSLIQRFWGTSLKSSAKDSDSAFAQNALPKNGTTADSNVKDAPEMQSGISAFATISAASSSGGNDDTQDVSRRAATVTGRTRSRRPTAESLFAPSPFAYNKRLATATPSVANLRDVDRVKEQSPALSRRHSVGRLDSRHPRLSAGTHSSASYMGIPGSGGNTMPTRYMSSSDARRLLNTINLISTPINEARSRPAGTHITASGEPVHESPSDAPATISHGSSLLPFRRLPLSLLALSDTPEKAPRVAMVDTSNVLDKETLRRSNSLKNTPRLKNKAPSLARTIQLQQARKAVAERLMRDRLVSSGSEIDTEPEYYAAAEAEPSREDGMASESLNAGTVHGRDESDENKPRKRRHMENGEAMDVSADAEMSEDDEHKVKGRTTHKRSSRRRRVVSFGRSTSAANESVRWRFSARFEPFSDDGKDSSSESDDDREAIASKVPVSKIRGGELIGLSLRPTSSASSSSIPVAPTVRSTGFGGTRTPIQIGGEAKKTAMPASKPTASILSVSEPKPTAGFTLPDSTTTTTAATATATTAATTTTPGPTSSSLFGNLAAKSQEDVGDSKPGSEAKETKATAGFVPASAATSSAPTKPVFTFGKTAESTGESNATLTSVSESKDATSKAFNFGKKPDASTPEETSKGVETPSKPAVAFSFGSKADSLPAKRSEELDKPVGSGEKEAAVSSADKPKAGALPKFSFTVGTDSTKNSSAPSATEPAPAFSFKSATTTGANGSFSFGLKTTSKPESASTPAPTTSAPEDTSKPAFSFGFNPSGTASTVNADKKEEPKDKPAFSIFGGGTSTDASVAKDASKVSDDTGNANKSGFGTGTTSIFGSLTKPEPAKRPADDKLATASSNESETKSTAFGFKPSGNFSFEKPAGSGAGAGAASTGPGFNFGTSNTSSAATSTASLPSFSVAAPAKTIDLTTSVANTSTATAAAPTATGSSASTPNMFSGFGKPTPTPATSAVETSGSAMDSNMAEDKKETPPSGFGGFTAKQSFGGFGTSGSTSTTPFSKPPALGSLAQQNPPSGGDQNTKKFAFSFGTANTPSAASFETTTVPTPAVTSFGSAATSTTAAAQSFGAPAATPSAFNFGVASSPAATPSATPATSSFAFGSRNTSQPPSISKPPQSSMFGGAQSSTAANAFGSASSQAMTNNTSASSFGGGFGSASASATNNGFGSTMNASGAPVQSNTGFGGTSSGGFNFSSNVSTTSAFGGGGQPSGGFGQQSNVSTSSAFNSQPSGGFGASAGNTGFGVGSNASTFGTGAPSTAGSGAPQFMFGQNTGASTGSFQFNAGGSSAFGGNSSVANSTPTTPFAFGSNTSLQGGAQTGSFQFTSGANQQSNTGVGGMTLGRVAGGSNASTSSHGRLIARPRTRRPR